MTTPYTYLVGWSKLNRYYYGRRTGKNCSPTDLWDTYFTSSTHVALYRAEHGEPDVIVVRRTFCSVDKCRAWEEKVLRRLKAAQADKFLNRRNGDKSNTFNTNGTAHAKNPRTGELLGPVSILDGRWETGEIVGTRKGCTHSPQAKQAMSEKRKGTAVGVIVETGKTKRIPLTDPRWKTGEVISVTLGRNRGMSQTETHIQKRAESRRKNAKGMPAAARQQWSIARKGKKPAFTQAGDSLGLVDVNDPRWGREILSRQELSQLNLS